MRSWLASVIVALVALVGTQARAELPPAITASMLPKGAFAPAVEHPGTRGPAVTAALLSARNAVEPGATLKVGVQLTPAAGWHVYWKNPGDSALPTQITLSADKRTPAILKGQQDTFSPVALDVGPVQWPVPRQFTSKQGALTTFGYDAPVTLVRTVTVPKDASGTLRLTAKVALLACKVDCVPGEATLTWPLTVQKGAVDSVDNVIAAHFALAAERTPVAPDARGASVGAALAADYLAPGDAVDLTLTIRGCTEAPSATCQPLSVPTKAVPGAPKIPFFAARTEGVSFEVRDLKPAPGGARLFLHAKADQTVPKDATQRAGGVLWLQGQDGLVALDLDVPLARRDPFAPAPAVKPAAVKPAAASATPAAPAAPALPNADWTWLTLLQMLGLAFVGGAILNLMPCVFPVLAIKVMGVLRTAGESRTEVLRHGVAYTAGILASMLGLAIAVIALRSAGAAVGWGFQFQEPLFVISLAVGLVVFGLNLMGVFQVGVSADGMAEKVDGSDGLLRSAGEGVLAVVLATPCSAPMLGTAVGFAMSAPPFVIVLIFLSLGLGLALPFVALTLSPALQKRLPRPGPWLDMLKKVLSFALFGTVLWLLWVLGSLTDADTIVKTLAVMLATAFASVMFGTLQAAQGNTPRALTIGAILFGAVLLLGGWLLGGVKAGSVDTSARAAAHDGPIAWEVFDEPAIQERLKKGQVVFVDFTADWCITCKVNEKTVILTDPVLDGLKRLNVATFKGDYTKRDPRIQAVLQKNGKAGVPMYLVYSPKAPDAPEVLPEVLTPSVLVSAFERAMP